MWPYSLGSKKVVSVAAEGLLCESFFSLSRCFFAWSSVFFCFDLGCFDSLLSRFWGSFCLSFLFLCVLKEGLVES